MPVQPVAHALKDPFQAAEALVDAVLGVFAVPGFQAVAIEVFLAAYGGELKS